MDFSEASNSISHHLTSIFPENGQIFFGVGQVGWSGGLGGLSWSGGSVDWSGWVGWSDWVGWVTCVGLTA